MSTRFCNWYGCTEISVKGKSLCAAHQTLADRLAEQERNERAAANKNDGLTYHDKSGDHRHGEKAAR